MSVNNQQKSAGFAGAIVNFCSTFKPSISQRNCCRTSAAKPSTDFNSVVKRFYCNAGVCVSAPTIVLSIGTSNTAIYTCSLFSSSKFISMFVYCNTLVKIVNTVLTLLYYPLRSSFISLILLTPFPFFLYILLSTLK